MLGFRPLTRADLPLFGGWLSAPHVAAWWRDPHDPEALEREYGPAIDGSDATEVFVVELEGDPVGIIQRYPVSDDPEFWGQAAVADGMGIDYLIGVEGLIGRGLGPRVIGEFCAMTFGRWPDVERIVAAVLQENRRSWRALEKAGFARVWEGLFVSDSPSDDGPEFVYALRRPGVT